MRNGRRLRAAIACGAMLAVAATSTSTGATLKRRARVAAAYTVDQQADNGAFVAFSKIGSTADAILALAAARRGEGAIDKAVRYLKRKSDDEPGSPNAIDTIGERAKVILALRSVGRNARSFGGRNFVREIRAARADDGSYSDLTFQEVIDQALALLALRSVNAKVPQAAWEWMVAAQCPDGGWQFDRPYDDKTDDKHCFNSTQFDPRSDTNTTSIAVQALALQYDVAPANPFPFFRSARDKNFKDGWVYEPSLKCKELGGDFCYITDANSTSLTIQAYLASGRDIPNGGMKALRRLQNKLCGQDAGGFSFTWNYTGSSLEKDDPNLGATSAAIPALMKKPFPLAPVDVKRGVPQVGAC